MKLPFFHKKEKSVGLAGAVEQNIITQEEMLRLELLRASNALDFYLVAQKRRGKLQVPKKSLL
jgi:hypothetical protein